MNLPLPPFLYGPTSSAGITLNTYTIDSATKIVAAILSMREAATLTHAVFRYGARTGTPPTYKISLQGVDGSGNPDGVDVGGGSPTLATFTPPADTSWNSTRQEIALTNAYTCSRGEFLAVVVEYSSGTVDASNNGSFTSQVLSSETGRLAFPYGDVYTGAAWSHTTGNYGAMAVRSTSEQFGFVPLAGTTWAAGTDGHRAALKFALPAEWGATYQIVGMKAFLTVNSGSTNTLGLWNAAGTALQAVSLYGDYSSAVGSGARLFTVFFDEATLATLDFGTTYYLGIERAGSTPTVYGLDYGSTLAAGSGPYGSGNAMVSEWNGSAWSDSDAKVPYIIPILNDWTEPAGGSTGIPPVLHPFRAVY